MDQVGKTMSPLFLQEAEEIVEQESICSTKVGGRQGRIVCKQESDR